MNEGRLKPSTGVIGVLGAMQSEVSGLVAAMAVDAAGTAAGFDYWQGVLAGRRCVVARCGMGKVSAAAAVQRLIDAFGAGCIVLCGLAGGLGSGLTVGDIVVGERFIQYDIDASPIFPRYHVPGIGIDFFSADARLVAAAEAASLAVADTLTRLASTRRPRVHRGLIVTGDQFVRDDAREALMLQFPGALCVEMEGGAIAQVCYLNDIPFVVVRVISDNADAAAPVDFMAFVNELAPVYTVSIVKELLSRLP